LNELTVNVTQFFRDSDVYEKLREKIVPGIMKTKGAAGNKSLRIWSAGCASGEEPYSIAILINEVLGVEGDSWNVRVVGSDYDDESLKVARAGVYRDIDLPAEIEPTRYFAITAKGARHEYKVLDVIRNNVRFEKINLLEHETPRQFDMVVCRNVLIYFGREMQIKLMKALAGGIRGEGYLVLGKSETIGPEASKFLKPVFSPERIYQLINAKKPASKGSGNG
jgi:chemotaxis methyl-accepting protein methylase